MFLVEASGPLLTPGLEASTLAALTEGAVRSPRGAKNVRPVEPFDMDTHVEHVMAKTAKKCPGWQLKIAMIALMNPPAVKRLKKLVLGIFFCNLRLEFL